MPAPLTETHRGSLTALMAFARALTMMLCTGAASAEDAPPSATAEWPLPPKPDCKKTALTKEKFLEMVKAIATHGDLSDVAFIEKTLQVKFKRLPDKKQRQVYIVSFLQDVPIGIHLEFDSHYRNTGSEEKEPKWTISAFCNLTIGVLANCFFTVVRHSQRMLLSTNLQESRTRNIHLQISLASTGLQSCMAGV